MAKKKKHLVRYRVEYSDGVVEIMEEEDFYTIYQKFIKRASELKLSVMAEVC